MAARYKQKCNRCRKKYVLASWKNNYVLCYDCQKKDLQGEITDPEMIKFFDLPQELYEKSPFLRNIKIAYLRYRKLTERQIEAFKQTVERLQTPKSADKVDSDDQKDSV